MMTVLIIITVLSKPTCLNYNISTGCLCCQINFGDFPVFLEKKLKLCNILVFSLESWM